MKNKVIYIFAAVLAFFSSCGDSLEDTYKDYAGDGPIRYTGKCTNISVNPGWECLRAKWTPSKDPAVKNIRITWISENSDTTSAEVAPTDTSYTIKGLTNQNYRVLVQSIANDGTPSLDNGLTRRPYTYEHEAVTAFTQGFNKYYLYKNHLLLFMGNWSDGIVKFDIAYTNRQGNADTLHLTKDVFNEQNVDVADVDFSKDITLQRRGMIEGCPDTIDFQPVKLTKNFLMNSDFKKELRQHYGLGTDDVENFAASAQTIGLDYNLYSLEDLLYFPNLKTVNLGARRYMLSSHLVASTVTELKRALWVINKLHEIGGVTVNMYANAYLGASAPSFVNRHSVATVPVTNFYSTNGWSITTSEDDSNNSELKNLLDGSATTDWKSWPSDNGMRSFDLVINMKSDKTIHGVAIEQSQNSDVKNFLPENVIVEYATAANPDTWVLLNGIDEYTLGSAQGETTIIKAAKAVDAKYLRITVKERTYNGITRVALAGIKVY